MVVKVDLVIENAWVYRTFRQCFERMDIAVTGGKFLTFLLFLIWKIQSSG